jgi:hypothetical protein
MQTFTLLIYIPHRKPIKVQAKGKDAEDAYEKYSESIGIYYTYRVLGED